MEPTTPLENPAPARSSAPQWSLIALLLAAAFVLGLHESTRDTAALDMLNGMTHAGFGNEIMLINHAFNGTFVLCSLLAGWLIGRLGYNRLFILGASGVLLGIVGWAMRVPWPLPILFEGLIGAGQGLIMTAAITYIVTLSKPINLFVLLFAISIGSLVGWLIFSFRAVVLLPIVLEPMRIFNYLMLASAILLAIFIAFRWRWRTYMPTGEAFWFHTFEQTLRTPRSWMVLVLFVVVRFVMTALGQGAYLISWNADPISVNVLFQTIAIAEILGLVIAAVVSLHWSASALIPVSLMGACIAAVRIATLPDDASGYGLFALCAAPLYGLVILRMYRVLGIHHLPSIVGIEAALRVALVPMLASGFRAILTYEVNVESLSAILIGSLAIFALVYGWTLRSEAVRKKKAEDYGETPELDP
ncbi:MAG: hypothetical protein KC519_05770, partial [Anaerolineae bacterium]|nr:hypothetical protein [Anaerolineae bacterium]